jgi:DNA ligase-1
LFAATPNRRGVLLALAGASALVSTRPSEASSPHIMRPGRYTPGQPVDGFLISEKLDGVRGRWDGRQMWSRTGHQIHTSPEFTAGWPSLPMDGELWAGRGHFQVAVAAVRSGASHPAWGTMRFMAFDTPSPDLPFGLPGGRLELLTRHISQQPEGFLQAVEQSPASTEADLMQRLSSITEAGGEGLVLHRAEGLYRSGRSNDLLKYKLFDDAEAQVVQVLPGKGQFKGMAGAPLVQTLEGHRLRLGSGMSEAQRRDPPPPGSWVTYRYQGLHPGGVPRFATFLRVVPQGNL